jgi:CspA family cold shock protein
MATGTVKWFSDEKGYGFITPDESGKDLFVHHRGIGGEGFKSLAEGAKVSYDAEPGVKGPRPSTSFRSRRNPARARRGQAGCPRFAQRWDGADRGRDQRFGTSRW